MQRPGCADALGSSCRHCIHRTIQCNAEYLGTRMFQAERVNNAIQHTSCKHIAPDHVRETLLCWGIACRPRRGALVVEEVAQLPLDEAAVVSTVLTRGGVNSKLLVHRREAHAVQNGSSVAPWEIECVCAAVWRLPERNTQLFGMTMHGLFFKGWTLHAHSLQNWAQGGLGAPSVPRLDHEASYDSS